MSCCPEFKKAFPVQSSYMFTVGSAVFDERNLVSAAGLVPVLELAEQTGLSELISEHVDLPSTRVKSGAVNPAGKLTTIIAGMMCGADSIDDANVLRAGGTPRVFDEVYAPSTLGIFLREFTFGHANQLAAVARAHLVALAQRTALLPGSEQRVFVDIDSLLRPVYGHHKQGASFGHAKIASRALLRLGLSPQITTLSTATAPPVIAEAQLRSGKAGSGRGAAAQRSDAALTKAARKHTEDDHPVHSFTSLLADLATICVNHIQPTDDMPAFTKLTTPTPLQRRAFELLDISHRLGYM